MNLPKVLAFSVRISCFSLLLFLFWSLRPSVVPTVRLLLKSNHYKISIFLRIEKYVRINDIIKTYTKNCIMIDMKRFYMLLIMYLRGTSLTNYPFILLSVHILMSGYPIFSISNPEKNFLISNGLSIFSFISLQFGSNNTKKPTAPQKKIRTHLSIKCNCCLFIIKIKDVKKQKKEWIHDTSKTRGNKNIST